jgi:signal transduction histidine kinase
MERLVLGGLSRRLEGCTGVEETLAAVVGAVADLVPGSIAVAAVFDAARRVWRGATARSSVGSAPGTATAPSGPGSLSLFSVRRSPAAPSSSPGSEDPSPWLDRLQPAGTDPPDVADAARRAGLELVQVDLTAGDGRGLLALLRPPEPGTSAGDDPLRPVLADAAAQATLALRARVIAERLAEQEREQQEQQLFLSVAAHDLRTPLASIRGYAQLLLRQRQASYSAQQRTSLETIIQQADRLAALTEIVLDVARIQNRRLALRPVDADLGEVVREAAGAAQALPRSPEIRLHLPDTGLRLQADPLRLGQIVRGLVEFAAARATREEGVEVSVTSEGEGLLLAVDDSGPVLDEGERLGLFSQLVERGEEGTSPALGPLGLFIARGAAEAHGGRAWADSPAPGRDRGARLNVWLPAGDGR